MGRPAPHADAGWWRGSRAGWNWSAVATTATQQFLCCAVQCVVQGVAHRAAPHQAQRGRTLVRSGRAISYSQTGLSNVNIIITRDCVSPPATRQLADIKYRGKPYIPQCTAYFPSNQRLLSPVSQGPAMPLYQARVDPAALLWFQSSRSVPADEICSAAVRQRRLMNALQLPVGGPAVTAVELPLLQ